MKTIYKYPLVITDHQTVMMPAGAEILCVQVQRDVPCLWAIVDPQREPVAREIAILGTGHPNDGLSAMPYLGTFQVSGGTFVFHVFDVTL